MDGKESSEPAALLPKIVCVTTLAGSTETSGDAANMDGDPRPYSCPVCQKCFASRNYLTMHTHWLHDGLETAAANVNTSVESIVLPSSPSATLPPDCKVTALLLPGIVSVTTLTDSAETSGDAAIKDSDPGIPDGAITTSAKQSAKAVHSGNKRHACSTCGARFVWRQSLIQHERTHTGEQPFQCGYCSVTFTCSDRLKNHILTHTSERTHECDVCGMRFKLKKTLVKHHRIHTSDRYYMCEQCPAAFCQKESLTRHMRLHECGVDVYHCPICKRAFSHSPNLTLHMRVMHNVERPAEMVYTCKQCPATFARSDTLRDHILTHTGERTHECDVCGKRFKLKNTLVGHRHTHTSEMHYACDQCPAVFRRNETLKKHMRLHECGVEAYHCPICKMAFSFSPKLTLHMRLMHNGGRLGVMGNDCKATPSPPSSHSSTLLPVNIKTEDCGDLSNMDELITGDVYL